MGSISSRIRALCMAPMNRIEHTESSEYRAVRSEIGAAFPMSLRAKMFLTVGTLLISMVAAPAVYLRRAEIREIEGLEAAATADVMSLFVGFLFVLGNVSTFVVGLYMLKYVRDRASPASSRTREEMVRELRREDFVMWFQLWGTFTVLAGVLLITVPALLPGAIEPMYEQGLTVYRPFETFTLDIRLVAVFTGGIPGVILGGLWWYLK